MSAPIVQKLEQITMDYRLGRVPVHALRGIDLEIFENEFVALAGASGSGKTTLLNLMGVLEQPTSGIVTLDNVNLSGLTETELSDVRAKKIGFVFQTFNLIPVLNALENVEYALLNFSITARERSERSREALERVGLKNLTDRRPDQLSGGQRQRVAIARAIVKKPRLLLADEPTANLDSKTAHEILDLILELNRTAGVTTVIASHDPIVLARVSRVVKIADGLRLS